MANENVLKKLAKLTERQREILILYCHGKGYDFISKRLFITKGAVRAHLANIYVKLELDRLTVYERRKIIFQIYCPALREFDNIPQESEPLEPEPIEPEPAPAYIMRMVDEDEKSIIVVDQRSKKPTNDPKPPFPPIGRWIILIALIVLLLLGGVQIFQWVASVFNGQQKTFENEKPTMQISPTEIVVDTSHESQPTINEIIPSASPQPTSLPQQKSLFMDNFDAGLSTGWQVVYGNPLVVNGLLTTDSDTMLIVGDSSWRDYAVEYDASAGFCWLSRAENWVSVRAVDTDNNYAYKWAFCESFWYIVKNGKWNEVPQSGFNPGSEEHHFKIQVEGGNMAVYVDGMLMSSLYDTSFSQGRVILRISENTTIDNFVIREVE